MSCGFRIFKNFRSIIALIFRNVGASTRIEIQDQTSNFTGLSSKNSIFSHESKNFEMVKIWAQNQGRDYQLRYYQKI